jgi:hypothetical protein
MVFENNLKKMIRNYQLTLRLEGGLEEKRKEE